jgi:hypothetical protein
VVTKRVLQAICRLNWKIVATVLSVIDNLQSDVMIWQHGQYGLEFKSFVNLEDK